MKNIIILLLFLPTLLFSQGIPKKLKILNVSYDKPLGTKIEKEKKEKRIRARTEKYFSYGLGIARTSFSKESYPNNLPINHIGLSWQRKLTPHGSISLEAGFAKNIRSEENKKLQTNLWQNDIMTKFHVFPSRGRFYRRRYYSPYLMGGIGFVYPNFEKANPKYTLGLGLQVRLADRTDLNLEYRTSMFEFNNLQEYLQQFQISVYQMFPYKRRGDFIPTR